MWLYVWLVFVFGLGACVGSFLNVAVARMPANISVFWPPSRCGKCLAPVRWYDNLPLVSYWWLGGRCRCCGDTFSMRYFLIELMTALGFVGLFYLEVAENVHRWPDPEEGWGIQHGFFPWEWFVGFLYHAVLFSFLVAAAACDLKNKKIPLRLPLTGTGIGFVGGVLMPWPWPHNPLAPTGVGLKEGIFPCPIWDPLPDWVAPGDNWQLGLANPLLGILAGALMGTAAGWLYGKFLGRDGWGRGHTALMMMAGSFLGWQPVVLAFFVSAVAALSFALFQQLVRKEHALPCGLTIAVGVIVTSLSWHWLGSSIQSLAASNALLIVACRGRI